MIIYNNTNEKIVINGDYIAPKTKKYVSDCSTINVFSVFGAIEILTENNNRTFVYYGQLGAEEINELDEDGCKCISIYNRITTNRLSIANELLYKNITELLIKLNMSISTMESCTSGLIATLLTNKKGASAIMKGAFVTYSNEAKIMQGVNANCIEENGVYSLATALEMANACKRAYNSNIGIGVTGIIDDPDPNNPSDDNRIYFAIVINDKAFVQTMYVSDNLTRLERKHCIAHNIAIYLTDMLTDILQKGETKNDI